MQKKNIVVLGGGTGTSTIINSLKKYPVNLTVAVSTWDDGGSSGRLRKEFGVLPPGDLRQCFLALSKANTAVKNCLAYRFPAGELKGHVAGNLLLAALEYVSGIDSALRAFKIFLKAEGSVLPLTLAPTTLSARLVNGQAVKGEHNIDEPEAPKRPKIKSLSLFPSSAQANPKVIRAITGADMIIFGPGDLYTSTLPAFLVSEVRSAILRSRARKVLIVNLMTKSGQTEGFKASDFVNEIENYLGGSLDAVLVNVQEPDKKHLDSYAKEHAFPVKADLGKANAGKQIICGNFINRLIFKKAKGDALFRSFLRHDGDKLSKILYNLLKANGKN